MVEDLQRRGIKRSVSAPPLFRLLWRLGAEVRPPLFLPRRHLILCFGAPWGACMTTFNVLWAYWWPLRGSHAWQFALAIWPTAGLCFGLWMAGYYRRRASTLALPPWESYGFDRRAPEVFS